MSATTPAFTTSAETPKADTPTAGTFLTIGGVSRIVHRSPSRIRELAAEIGLPDVRAGSIRVFDAAAVAKLRAEIERREREAAR